jgi:hypothetical protein
MIHFEQTISHQRSFSSVIVFIHESSVHAERLSPRCNLSMKFPVFYHFTTSNWKCSSKQLSSVSFWWFYDDADALKWIWFQTITKHRIGFVLCFRSNGTFLWLSFISSLSRGVIIIVSEAGDRTKKQLKFQSWVFRTVHAFWPWKLVH